MLFHCWLDAHHYSTTSILTGIQVPSISHYFQPCTCIGCGTWTPNKGTWDRLTEWRGSSFLSIPWKFKFVLKINWTEEKFFSLGVVGSVSPRACTWHAQSNCTHTHTHTPHPILACSLGNLILKHELINLSCSVEAWIESSEVWVLT